MFKTPRMHRWLTVPASVALLAAPLTSLSLLYFLLFAPPTLALPFIAHAAVRQTPVATARALIATRFSALLLALIGLVAVTETPGGLLWIGAAGLQLLAAGTGRDERRLGAATIVTGLLVVAASWLLVWIGTNPYLLLSGAGFLVAGGAIWVIEAQSEPLRDEDFPTMELAA